MRQKAEKYADVHRAVSCADKPWSERKQSTPGYMTVYLALVMGILLSLILAVLTAVRISTIRMYIECCADMALDSALAEYHREMLDQYDLFFIDTAYQTGDPSYHRTEEHIFRYMERNLRPQEEFPTAGAKDLLGLSTEDVELLQAGVATDDGGTVLQYHIVQYMKDISGLSLAETLLEQGNQLEDLQGRDLEAEWDAAEESLKEEIFRRKKLQDKDWDGEIPETPSDAVRATRSEGILGAAVQGMQLSSACLSGAGRPSVRHLNSGTGLSDGKEAVNAAFLFGSSLKAEAETAAGVIAILLGLPEIKDLAATVILFAWAYAESVKDVRILLRGDKIPLVKSEGSWNTPFSQLLTYRSHLDSYRSSADGMSYQDYLGALLVCHGAKKAIAGLMDVMESDIRQTPGNSNFRLDGLIDGMQACIRVVSGYTGSYEITRRYEYE